MQRGIEGKNCIITGANSGIGYATAEGLATRYLLVLFPKFFLLFDLMEFFLDVISMFLCFSGASVYMVCRNKEKGEAALSSIRSKTGNQNVHLEVFSFIFVPFSPLFCVKPSD